MLETIGLSLNLQLSEDLIDSNGYCSPLKKVDLHLGTFPWKGHLVNHILRHGLVILGETQQNKPYPFRNKRNL